MSGFCGCGGEITDWCFECGDWMCDDCGCPWPHDDYWHDRQHPAWSAGCDDCVERSERIEADRRLALTAPPVTDTEAGRDA